MDESNFGYLTYIELLYDSMHPIKYKRSTQMTKAFLEPIVLKPKNEDLVRKAFSKESLNKVRDFNKSKRTLLKRTTHSKIAISELF